MVSRTSVANPSAPLRKSTGLVATITRTAPVGPITRRHRSNSLHVRTAADPYRHAVDLDLNRSSTRLSLALRGFALAANRRCRRGNIHDRWHELQSIRLRKPNLGFSHLPTPAKQLLWRQSMPSRHTRNRVAARHDLRDDPRLVLITNRTPTARAGETFQAARRLRDNIMHCVHSKPSG